MLRLVLRDYLNGLKKERHFDGPFGLLLPTMGFYDVHFTHGTIEFGKDFIAKKQEQGAEIQYSFQLKRGNIDLPEWTDRIQHQMLQSVVTPLRHPGFDRTLAHQAVLVTTGEVTTIASMAVDELNAHIRSVHRLPPISVWTQSNLIDTIIDCGVESMHAATVEGFAEYGEFFQMYSRAIRGQVMIGEVEIDSRRWTRHLDDFGKWALWCSLEAEALAQQCVRTGQTYEAGHVYLGRLRAICSACYERPNAYVTELFHSSLPRIIELCVNYVEAIKALWAPQQDLMQSELTPTDIVTYPVQCGRILEIASLLYFLSDHTTQKTRTAQFLNDFILAEPGTAHPVSDRHAVSLAMAALVLSRRF